MRRVVVTLAVPESGGTVSVSIKQGSNGSKCSSLYSVDAAVAAGV